MGSLLFEVQRLKFQLRNSTNTMINHDVFRGNDRKCAFEHVNCFQFLFLAPSSCTHLSLSRSCDKTKPPLPFLLLGNIPIFILSAVAQKRIIHAAAGLNTCFSSNLKKCEVSNCCSLDFFYFISG